MGVSAACDDDVPIRTRDPRGMESIVSIVAMERKVVGACGKV